MNSQAAENTTLTRSHSPPKNATSGSHTRKIDQTKAKFINALMNSQAAENTILTLVHRPLKKAVSGAHVCISKASGE
ncbi:hypothetical protein D3C84_1121230 [compost metagenome]